MASTRAATDGRAASSAIDDAVLADVRHDVRNQFHKLHYCIEVLRSSSASLPPDEAGVVDVLERTVTRLEDVVGAALDYVRPLDLRTIGMTCREVGDAIVALLAPGGGRGESVEVEPDVAQATVALDPGRFSAALQAVAARLAGSTDTGGPAVRLRRAGSSGRPMLEIEILAAAAPRGTAAPGGRGPLEWAAAARTVAAHGGRLLPIEGSGGAAGFSLSIPLAQDDASGSASTFQRARG